MKGTPGPWKYQEQSDAYTHIVRGPGNGFICQLLQDTSGIAEADARLIAAAPDMVDVLTELDEFQKRYEVASFGDKMPGNELYSGLLMAIVTKARTALAKAHGETQ